MSSKKVCKCGRQTSQEGGFLSTPSGIGDSAHDSKQVSLEPFAQRHAPLVLSVFGDRFGYMLITNPFRKITKASEEGREGGEQMVVILEGNGLITRGEEGRKEGRSAVRACHAMPCRGLITHFAAAFAPFII